MRTDLDSVERSLFGVPYIVGEMGAFKSHYGNNITQAAYGMRDVQVQSCELNAAGWLGWTWNTTEDLAHQREIFTMSESQGAVNGMLAPVARPNPCR